MMPGPLQTLQSSSRGGSVQCCGLGRLPGSALRAALQADAHQPPSIHTVRFRLRPPARRIRLAALVTVLVVCAIGKFPQYVYPMVLPSNDTESSLPTRRVYDEANFLTPQTRWRYEEVLGGILDESGADVRFVFVRNVPAGDLQSYALNRMRVMGVGKDVDRRGLLFVYDVGSKRLRIEVGPRLEDVFPDGFVGYLMREHTASFFATADPELGLRTTLRMIMMRMRVAALGMKYDPTAISFITDSVRLAAGGGATANAGSGVASPGFIGRQSTRDERAHFSAQPTVEQTHQRYLEWLRDGHKQVDVELFTPETRTYLRTLAMTRAYVDFILLGEYGQQYKIEIRGPRAMLYYTSTPFVSPHYYRRTEAGWQMDVVADAMNSQEYHGGRWTYGVIKSDDDFSYAFADMMDDYTGGMFRVRDGDNRPLPVHTKP